MRRFWLGWVSVSLGCAERPASGDPEAAMTRSRRVVIASDGWELIGDLTTPIGRGEALPAVLLLNKAAGNRTAYQTVAQYLAKRGVVSLRLDLRGHGESIDRGRFVPPANNGPTGAANGRALLIRVVLMVGSAHGTDLLSRAVGFDRILADWLATHLDSASPRSLAP